MKSIQWALLVLTTTFVSSAFAAEWLIKIQRRDTPAQLMARLRATGAPVVAVEDLRFNGWFLVKTPTEGLSFAEGNNVGYKAQAVWVEPNKKIRYPLPKARGFNGPVPAGNDPVYKQMPPRGQGPDPMASSQWALDDIGFTAVRPPIQGSPNVIVAVIDTGVDYNHPDLNPNIWINPGEAGAKANNGIDDDGNGYIDDAYGWDFVDNDNTPYDRTSFFGNPGHGTHCAGVIGAAANNGYGITGIASGVRIMPLRFLPENGEGTTANAVKAMKYAIDMGAWVMSNSWGGEDEQNEDSRALREIFAEAASKGRIPVVAAGNESLNVDAAPLKATPASFNAPTQITVAATGRGGSLAGFSNYGATLTHLGAPGVGILSTVPGGRFQNMDGTSMATPVVAGAVALFWSKNQSMKAMDVRNAVLSTTKATPSLKGRTMTGGRLDIQALLSLPPVGFRRP